MKVKMLTTACGPEMYFDAGKFHDVEDGLALEWIKKGYAQRAMLVDGKLVAVPEAPAPVEKAVASEPENAEDGLPQLETAEAKKKR